nr:hypothetical protein [Tanacetum cinerariifolium]
MDFENSKVYSRLLKSKSSENISTFTEVNKERKKVEEKYVWAIVCSLRRKLDLKPFSHFAQGVYSIDDDDKFRTMIWKVFADGRMHNLTVCVCADDSTGPTPNETARRCK